MYNLIDILSSRFIDLLLLSCLGVFLDGQLASTLICFLYSIDRLTQKIVKIQFSLLSREGQGLPSLYIAQGV